MKARASNKPCRSTRASHDERRRWRRQQQWRRRRLFRQQVAVGGRGDGVARGSADGPVERRREALLQLQVSRRAGQLQGPFQVGPKHNVSDGYDGILFFLFFFGIVHFYKSKQNIRSVDKFAVSASVKSFTYRFVCF